MTSGSPEESKKPAEPLDLPGNVHVAESHSELMDNLAAVMLRNALRSIQSRGVFHLALSGGSTPEPFYVRLVVDPRYRLFPWPRTHLWMVDERRVPLDDERSNFNMIRQSLSDHVPVRRSQVHPIPVDAPDPADVYERMLRELIAADPSADSGAMPCLDFVLLGMGEDGHTASLFPGSPALAEKQRAVVNNDGPNVTPPPRVTMTYPLLGAARELAILVTGQKKAAALRRVHDCLKHSGPDPAALPITGLAPHRPDTDVTWFLDSAAAGLESNGTA